MQPHLANNKVTSREPNYTLIKSFEQFALFDWNDFQNWSLWWWWWKVKRLQTIILRHGINQYALNDYYAKRPPDDYIGMKTKQFCSSKFTVLIFGMFEELRKFPSGVNFINILHTQITKVQKIMSNCQSSFALLGSARIKAVHEMLVKSTPVSDPKNFFYFILLTRNFPFFMLS